MDCHGRWLSMIRYRIRYEVDPNIEILKISKVQRTFLRVRMKINQA